MIKKTLLTAAAALCCLASANAIEPYGPVPTQAQLDWFDMERYAFLHYSINTYTNQEWGNGGESPELFNPSNLDCRQWARVCKEAGLQGIIITAKHHAGFCLWPSKYTEYSVKNSPWKNGQGDVLRELREACDEYGLKLGFYLSPWDRNRADYGQPSYIEYFRNQLTELLTEYGDAFEVWFDGANGGSGYYGGANETRNIDRTTYYDWPNTIKLIRQLQPNCLIWNCVGPDIRWCGNEQGSVGDTNWARYTYANHTPGAENVASLRVGEVDGENFAPAEVNVSIRPGWFYHKYEDMKVKDTKKLFDIYLKSVGNGSTWLLNFPVDTTGQIHPNDAKAAIEFNNYLKEAFKTDLAADAKVDKRGNTVELAFDQPVEFNLVQLMEDISMGQRIKEFAVDALIDGQWQPLCQGTTICHKRIVKVPDTKAQALRVTAATDAPELILPAVALFKAPEIVVDEDIETYTPGRDQWRIIAPADESMPLMFDGDKTTKAFVDQGLPLDVIVDMGHTQQIRGFRYLPDQGDYFLRGIITNYEFAVSADGENWTTVSQGEFSNIANNPLWQVVMLDKPVDARYFRFRPLRNTMDWGDMVCTEFDIIL